MISKTVDFRIYRQLALSQPDHIQPPVYRSIHFVFFASDICTPSTHISITVNVEYILLCPQKFSFHIYYDGTDHEKFAKHTDTDYTHNTQWIASLWNTFSYSIHMCSVLCLFGVWLNLNAHIHTMFVLFLFGLLQKHALSAPLTSISKPIFFPLTKVFHGDWYNWWHLCQI